MHLVRYVPPAAQLLGVIAPGSRKRFPVFLLATMRVRILVDFWNLQIAWNEFHEERGDGRPQIPWDARLPDVLTRHAGNDGSFHECHVYGHQYTCLTVSALLHCADAVS